MIVVEGVQNLALPCMLALLLPGMAWVALSGLRLVAAIGFVLGGGIVAWWQAVAGIPAPRAWWAALALGLVLAGVVVVLRRIEAGTGLLVPMGVAMGAIAGLFWEPCVGEHLGTVLTNAPTDAGGQLLPMLGYFSGATLPVWLAAGIGEAVDRDPLRDRAQAIGTAALGILALVLGAGLWDDVVSELVRLSV